MFIPPSLELKKQKTRKSKPPHLRRLCLGLMVAFAVNIQAADEIVFDIPAGPLGSTLTQFGDRAGLLFSFEPSITHNKTSSGLKGRFTVEEALQNLLSESGLSYRFIDETTAVVKHTPKSSTLALDTIRVTGTAPARYDAKATSSIAGYEADLLDITRSVQVVPEQIILDQQAIDLEETLKNVSGVHPVRVLGGTGESYILRGFRTTEVYQDGYQLTANGRRVQTANIEQIEVVKGATAILYGQTEPGGVINVISKKPQEEERNYISSTFDEHGRRYFLADTTGALNEDETLLYRLVASHEDSDTFRETDQSAEVRHTTFAPSLTWKITERDTLTASVEYTKADLPLDRGHTVVVDNFNQRSIADIPLDRRLGEDVDAAVSEQLNLRLDYTHEFNDQWKSQSIFHFEDTELDTFQHQPALGINTLINPNLSVVANLLIAPNPSDVVNFSGVSASNGLLVRSPVTNGTETENFFIAQRFVGDVEFLGLQHKLSFGGDFRETKTDSFQEFYLQSFDQLGLPAFLFPPGFTSLNFLGLDVIDINNPQYTNTRLPTTPANKTSVELKEVGIYLQDQITLNDQWLVSGGLRYDRIDTESETTSFLGTPIAGAETFVFDNTTTIEREESTTGSKTTPNLGVLYRPRDNLSFYLSYSESFTGNFVPSGTNTSVLDRFEVSEGVQYETGIKGSLFDDSLNFNLALYDLTLENVLDGVNPQTGQPEFNGEQESRGVEVDVNVQFLDGWNLIFAYAYTDAEITESSDRQGNVPSGVAEHTARIWGSYEFTKGDLQGLGFGLGAYYADDRFADGANTLSLDSYTTYDAGVWYHLPVGNQSQMRLQLGVKNLTDEEFFTPGTVNFRLFPGQPRTWFASLAMEF